MDKRAALIGTSTRTPQAVIARPDVARRRTDVARGRPVKRRRSAVELDPPAGVVSLAAVRSMLEGRRVLVLGSAPLATPITVKPGELTVCINGAVSSLPGRTPDIWLVNSRVKPLDRWTRERRFLHTTMMAQAAGRHIRTVAFMTRMEGAEDYTAAVLSAQGTTFDRCVVISRHARERIEVLARVRTQAMRKDACSAGVFGVILALWAGAAAVRMEGFSFERGYHYLPGHPLPANCRAHVDGDRIALREIARQHNGRVSGSLFDSRHKERQPA